VASCDGIFPFWQPAVNCICYMLYVGYMANKLLSLSLSLSLSLTKVQPTAKQSFIAPDISVDEETVT